ncbi:MAG: hypothetical protein HY688_03340 [Chloroflexi bacterium]|nr:hypothetical protein [Chloroflexota bacterium]
MPLKLAGEEIGAIQGLDGQGWLREIAASDSLPALKINQAGVGRLLDLQDGGLSKLHGLDGGRIVVADSVEVGANPAATGALRLANAGEVVFRNAANSSDLVAVRVESDNKLHLGISAGMEVVAETPVDVRLGLKNTGAADGGDVAVLEGLRVKGSVVVRSPADDLNMIALSQTQRSFYIQERSAHIADGSVDEDFAWVYVLNDGTNYQFVVKLKVNGVVKTGTLTLA